MKRILSFILMLLCLPFAACAEESVHTVSPQNPDDALDVSALKQAREQAWNEYAASRLESEELKRETEEKALVFGDATMRYTVEVKGEMPEGGYPLYIALHGGGQSDTPDINDDQWRQMQYYYSRWLKCGVYVAVRGVRDTWDTHFNPESYPLYDRLIEYMILTQNVNPNRVYLEGFSAGGDGVYAVSPRMADRFAAVNMSSGHPNGISLLNLYNLPIQLQAGEFDSAYDRNKVTAEYGLYLDALREDEPEGYEHRTLIHFNAGHNYDDYSPMPLPTIEDYAAWYRDGTRTKFVRIDSFPPDYMSAFTREPLPQRIVWELAVRAERRQTDSFYYLRADESASGVLRVTNRGDNTFVIDASAFGGDFEILLNEDMVDFEKPVRFVIGEKSACFGVVPDLSVLKQTTAERGDPNYQFEAAIRYSEIAAFAN